MLSENNRVLIVGSRENDCKKVRDVLEQYTKCCITVANEKNWNTELNIGMKKIEEGTLDAIVLADSVSVFTLEKNVTNENIINCVYEVPYEFFKKNAFTETDVNEIFTPMITSARFGVIQFDLTDKCNLNCNLCSHFSPLVTNERRYTLCQFEKDLRRVKELSSHVDDIDLWGGESLLHPDLEEMVSLTREVFPDSLIAVGTNGLLIPKMKESLFETMNNARARFIISGYPPTMQNWDKIKEKLIESNVNYKLKEVGKFFKRTDMSGQNKNNFQSCISRVCHLVFDGRFSPCYFPMSLEILEKYFNKKIDVKDSIFDLYDETLDKEKFSRLLKTEITACKYCGKKTLSDWSICNREKTTIEDWVHNASYITENAEE